MIEKIEAWARTETVQVITLGLSVGILFYLACIIHKKLQVSFITMIISKLRQTTIEILFNALSLTAIFTRGLRCLENGLLNVRRWTFPPPFPTPTAFGVAHTTCFGE